MKLNRALTPDLGVLQAFEAAARHENFTKAAAELSLTQSAVSRQIQALEDQFGVRLFERIRKRVILSSAGRKVLPDVRRLLVQSEEMVVRARAASDGSDVLAIATLPTFGVRWLLPRLPDFVTRHPSVIFDISSHSEPFDMMAENVDLAIHYGQPVWAHATCTYLCSEVIVPVASPSILRREAVVSPEDVARHPLLHLATRPKAWAEWFKMVGFECEQAYRGNRFDQFSMIIEAAVRGLGLALLPIYLIERELASGALQVVLNEPMTTENSYYVVLPETRRDGMFNRIFQRWLLDQVGASGASNGIRR